MVVSSSMYNLSFLILYHRGTTMEMCVNHTCHALPRITMCTNHTCHALPCITMCTNHTCPALPCITMCTLPNVAGDTQIWAVLCSITYMTCTQCASIIPVLRHHTTRHMKRWGGNFHIFLRGKVHDTAHDVYSPSVPSWCTVHSQTVQIGPSPDCTTTTSCVE